MNNRINTLINEAVAKAIDNVINAIAAKFATMYPIGVTILMPSGSELNKHIAFEYPKHSFHNPIEKEDLEKYNNLNICVIEKLETYGEDINELLSLQFCDKVYNFLKNVAF